MDIGLSEEVDCNMFCVFVGFVILMLLNFLWWIFEVSVKLCRVGFIEGDVVFILVDILGVGIWIVMLVFWIFVRMELSVVLMIVCLYSKLILVVKNGIGMRGKFY